MWGAASDERNGLSFVAVIAVHVNYIYNFTCFNIFNTIFVVATILSSSDSTPLSCHDLLK
jgi:hypothetical protein